MDIVNATLISALITGIFGPILTLVIQRRLKNNELPTPSKERLNRLKGVWYGYFKQVVSGQEMTFKVTATLNNQGRAIKGDAKYQNSQGERVCFLLYDGIFDGNILKIEYKNKLAYVFQNGTLVLEMNARGDLFQGKFIGYAPDERQIIGGEVKFTSRGFNYLESLPAHI